MTRLPARLLAPVLAAALLTPFLAHAQGAAAGQASVPHSNPPKVPSPKASAGSGQSAGAQGRQRNQPFANQNQSQLQANQSEQPPEVTGSRPTPGAGRPPMPTLAK